MTVQGDRNYLRQLSNRDLIEKALRSDRIPEPAELAVVLAERLRYRDQSYF